jgi:hypothetical protein
MIKASIEYRIPGLGTAARLIAFGAAAAIGVLIQLFVPYYGLALGALAMATPLALLSVKPWTNKPKDLGEEDWQPTGLAELDRIADAFRAAKKLKIPYRYRPGSGVFTVVALFAVGVFCLLGEDARLAAPFLDAAILFWPAMLFVRVVVWVPKDFEMVVNVLQVVRNRAAGSGALQSDLVLTPYLRLDRDAAGLRIPEDARLMLEPRRKPNDLVGVQFQAAINNGPNGKVPYLYAVVITRGQGASHKVAAAHRDGKFVVEPGGDADYGTVVIRQQTSGGGYFTRAEDCSQLYDTVVRLLDKLKARA